MVQGLYLITLNYNYIINSQKIYFEATYKESQRLYSKAEKSLPLRDDFPS
jgi:hypothetical protein